jgi:hypothetical protein
VDEKSKMGLIFANKTAKYYMALFFSSRQNKNYLSLPPSKQNKTPTNPYPMK